MCFLLEDKEETKIRHEYIREIIGYYEANQGPDAVQNKQFFYSYLRTYIELVEKGLVGRAELMECFRDQLSRNDILLYKFLGMNSDAIEKLLNASKSIHFSDISKFACKNMVMLRELFENANAMVHFIKENGATLKHFEQFVYSYQIKSACFVLKHHEVFSEYISKGYIESFDELAQHISNQATPYYLSIIVNRQPEVIKLYEDAALDFGKWLDFSGEIRFLLLNNADAVVHLVSKGYFSLEHLSRFRDGFESDIILNKLLSNAKVYSSLILNDFTTAEELLDVAKKDAKLFDQLSEPQKSDFVEAALHEFRAQNTVDVLSNVYDTIQYSMKDCIGEILQQRPEEADVHQQYFDQF